MNRLLVVEDDPGQQNLLQMIFKYSVKLDIVTDNTYNLKDAVEQLEKNEYKMVVCDLRLPYSANVLDTIETIEKHKGSAKVIYCTVEDIDPETIKKIKGYNSLFVSKNLDFMNYLQLELESYLRIS
ncbi:MAG: response regulator [Candidatus Kapaibacterium sp.]|nr:response regulator [Ignavibacteriota bacterium]MCB9220431.1 response regulator [Ignavibacteria bacterium]